MTRKSKPLPYAFSKDDVWYPAHLENAVNALKHGHDACFADWSSYR